MKKSGEGMESEVPDFGRFLDEQERDAASQLAREAALASDQEDLAAEALRVLRLPDSLRGRLEREEFGSENRRLVFQGGFVRGARVSKNEEGEKDRRQSRSGGFFPRNFLKGKMKDGSGESTDSEGQGRVHSFATVREYLEACDKIETKNVGVAELLQAYVFDDIFVLAKPDEMLMHVVLACPLEFLSVRDVGSGAFVLEDDVKEEDEDGHERDLALVEKFGCSMLEVCDASLDMRLVLDCDGPENKSQWITVLVDAAMNFLREERPIRASSKACKHEILRGTVWSAAYEGHAYEVRQIIDQDPSKLHEIDESGATALHFAAMKGHTLVIQYFLAQGALANALDDDLMCPLHYSATEFQARAAECMLKLSNDIDVDARDLQERTSLMLACHLAGTSSGQKVSDFIEVLAAYGADAEIPDVDGNTPVILCIKNANIHLLSALAKVGAKMETFSSGSDSQTPILVACSAEKPDSGIIGKLLLNGASTNVRDPRSGKRPIHLLLPAKDEERNNAIQLLLEFGARLDLADGQGKSVLDSLVEEHVDYEVAHERWKKRQEPEKVAALASSNQSHRIPYAIYQNSPGWQDDAEVSKCPSCAVSFNLMQRRKHCRRCGKIRCAACTSKTFTLKSPEDQQAMQQRVCDSCFNLLCRSMSVVVRDLEEVEKEKRERKELFADQEEEKQKKKREGEKQKKATDFAEKGVSRVQDTLSQAREALEERGERLSRLTDQSDQLNSNAQNFSSIARRLREREEKKASWFGGLF